MSIGKRPKKETQIRATAGLQTKKSWLPYALLVPSFAFFIIFSFWPFIKSIYLSFTITDMYGKAKKWVGLFNYQRVLQSEETWNIISVTFKFALLVGVGTFLIALVFALLSVDQVKHGKVYQVMFSMPMAIASVPAASMFIFLLSSKGIVNRLFGLSINWFGSADWAIIAIAIVTIWSHVGSSYLYLLVGFRNVPMDLRESARLDGAGWWSQVKNVLFPIASPQIFFVVFLNILNSFKTFSYFKLLTGSGVSGSTDVLIYQIYKQAFVFGRFETACTYSVFLFLIIFIFTRIQFALEKRTVHYQ